MIFPRRGPSGCQGHILAALENLVARTRRARRVLEGRTSSTPSCSGDRRGPSGQTSLRRVCRAGLLCSQGPMFGRRCKCSTGKYECSKVCFKVPCEMEFTPGHLAQPTRPLRPWSPSLGCGPRFLCARLLQGQGHQRRPPWAGSSALRGFRTLPSLSQGSDLPYLSPTHLGSWSHIECPVRLPAE